MGYKLMFRERKLLFHNRRLLFHRLGESSPCCCEEGGGFTPGTDCPTFCAAGTTPAQWNITFSGIANQVCGSSAYYNNTFNFVQDGVSPCKFNMNNGSGDTWAGPCGLGTTNMTITSTYIEIAINEVGGAIFLRCPHTSGDPCSGPFNFTYDHAVGAPAFLLQLAWTAATATANAV